MVQEILRRLRKATEDYQQEALDHARESQYNRDGQKREHKLQNEIRKCKAEMVSRNGSNVLGANERAPS